MADLFITTQGAQVSKSGLKVLAQEDFEARDGGCYLTNEGSKKFFRYFNDEFHSERKYHAEEAVTAAEYCAQLVAWAKMTVTSQNSTPFTDYLATATPGSKAAPAAHCSSARERC